MKIMRIILYVCYVVCGALGACNLVNGLPRDDGLLIMDRALLKSCQSTGIALYELCVAKGGAIDAKFCSATLETYKTCLYLLNRSMSLDAAYDPYQGKAFSPCGSQIANLILSDICLK